jgi:hypothetical protein
MKEDSEIKPENEWISNRRTKLYEHIDRMKCNRLVRKMRHWIPKGRWSLGRPKMKWNGTVKQEDNGCNRLQSLTQKRRGSSYDHANS